MTDGVVGTAGTTAPVIGPAEPSLFDDSAQDALGLLSDDHARIRALFDRYADQYRKYDAPARLDTVRRACMEIAIHQKLEAEAFYPCARETLANPALIDRAETDHTKLQELVAELQTMQVDSEFDERFRQLMSVATTHMDYEESALFGGLRDTRLDLIELGAKIKIKRDILKVEMIPMDPSS